MQRSRVTLAIHSPYAIPGPMSSETFLDLIRNTNASYVLTIPSYLEVRSIHIIHIFFTCFLRRIQEWSRDPVATECLKNLKAVVSNPVHERILMEPIRVGMGRRSVYP